MSAKQQSTPLTTGKANWQLKEKRGKYDAGTAPTTEPQETLGWIRPSEGSWLGSKENDWPPGSTEFMTTFNVVNPEKANFELE